MNGDFAAYKVIVKVDGRAPFTTVVIAEEQADGWTGKAQTRAMIAYFDETGEHLSGQFVGYEVTKLSPMEEMAERARLHAERSAAEAKRLHAENEQRIAERQNAQRTAKADARNAQMRDMRRGR
jgi:hypothetical protein